MNSKERIIFNCIDAYTAGNPVRLVKGPKPKLEGETIGEKRLHFIREYDWIRSGLMFEPHGPDIMSGSFFYDPDRNLLLFLVFFFFFFLLLLLLLLLLRGSGVRWVFFI